MTQKDMKFRVRTPDHSKAIQEKLFEMRIGWSGDDFTVKHTDRPFLYAEGQYLTFGGSGQFFTEDPNTECILTKDGKIVPLVDKDGFIYWEGGECPVPEGTLADVKYQEGHMELAIPALTFETKPGQRYTAVNWNSFVGGGSIVAYKLSEKQPALEAPVEAQQEPPAPQEQPIPSLRPQKEMWLDRAAELLAAMSLCIDSGQKIPYDWIEELANVNVHL